MASNEMKNSNDSELVKDLQWGDRGIFQSTVFISKHSHYFKAQSLFQSTVIISKHSLYFKAQPLFQSAVFISKRSLYFKAQSFIVNWSSGDNIDIKSQQYGEISRRLFSDTATPARLVFRRYERFLVRIWPLCCNRKCKLTATTRRKVILS